MPVRRQDKTTLLPQALLERIKEQDSSSGTPFPTRRKQQQARREKRDAEKNAKKQRKVDYFAIRNSAAKRSPPVESANANARDVDPPLKKRVKLVEPTPKDSTLVGSSAKQSKAGESSAKRSKLVGTTRGKEVFDTKKSTLARVTQEDLTRKISGNGVSRSQVELDEEKEIAWLEYQLRLSGGKKSYKKILQEDGLDDLLDGLEDTLMDVGHSSGSSSEEGASTGDSDLDEGEEGNDSDEETEWKGISMDVDDNAADETSYDDSMQEVASEAPTASKYVPPHLRKGVTQDDQKNVRLLRQLKGQLNRLSEQNISTVLSELEEIYRQNARNDVTTGLTSVMIDGITSSASLLDNHVALNAALVASLCRIVGIEFAAYFVQEVVKAYEKAYATAGKQPLTSDTEVIGKESLNLVVCIAELYNLEVVSCVLIYDIVHALLKEGMGELEVELLLKILRISGRQLRQDDPLALKDIVQLVSENTIHRKEDLSSRTRFMIETLTNLKNNRTKKLEASGTDTVERMRKFLAGLGKKYHAGREPLRVTLEDLRSAESKGKWWLVGAGWTGDPLVDNKRSRENEGPDKQQSERGTESQKMLDLAKKQGMNTDVRRSVFIVLMSSDDYFDACERLGQLNLTEQQQREIIRVLLHCCGNEKTYNPYYTLVGQRLCEQSHSDKITAQFCLWDFLRELGEGDVGGAEMLKLRDPEQAFADGNVSKERARNIAKLYAWWIARGSVSLAILKPLDFVKLKRPTREFLDTLFVDIFTNSQDHAPVLSKSGLEALWNRSKHSKRPIEEILLKAVRHETLARGLIVYFIGMEKRILPVLKEGERGFLKWCLETGKEALETGLSLGPQVD